ncbi:MAG: amino acid ABC transporter substrate-binding protein, partial [Rhodospirillales bacterium]|nr:amino acid ABC transporter substrate-binding protein [Rhodospirillales bacterium]
AVLRPVPGHSATLDSVKARGVLGCGVVVGQPGFARQDAAGRWQGFDVDLCRAFAAAALGDGSAVEIAALPAAAARAALAAGEVDLLARDEAGGGEGGGGGSDENLRLATFALIDAQSFLVSARDGPSNGLELDGAPVCVPEQGAAAANLERYAQAAGITLTPLVLASSEELGRALAEGRCRAISAGRLALAALRAEAEGDAQELAILPEVLSRAQQGPFVRGDDRGWLQLVRWTVFALIQAEESGVTRDNVLQLAATSEDPRLRRFLGASGGLGGSLGVADDWVVRIIEAVGNYGEIYGRHLGPGTPLGLERGPNALWNDGGLLHAMPFQ